MIGSVVEYEEVHRPLVDAYNALERVHQDPSYWSDAEVNSIRARVKNHYEREQGFRCCYCNIHLPTSHNRVWDAEHIVPKSTHPHFLFEPQNLAVSCIECNSAKDNNSVLVNDNAVRYPRRSEAFVIVHPHYDNMDDHIAVSLERFYLPKTRKGEKTIHFCRLTRYAYENLGWDSGLCDSELLADKFDDLLSAVDTGAQKNAMQDLLMIAQVRISRSLLSAPAPVPAPQAEPPEADLAVA